MAFFINALAFEIGVCIGALFSAGIAVFGSYKIISDMLVQNGDKALISQF
jgi:hypothetical protein